MRTLLACTLTLCAICTACNAPSPRLNAPPHGVPEATSDLQGTFVYMTDNALLNDMTVSDIHFLPHRPILSALGEQRLSRLAQLMEAWGGMVRFSTNLEDEDLIEERTEAIRAFLSEAGVDTSTPVVTHDLPGGAGLEAREVILIKADKGTYKPEKSESGSPPQPAAGRP